MLESIPYRKFLFAYVGCFGWLFMSAEGVVLGSPACAVRVTAAQEALLRRCVCSDGVFVVRQCIVSVSYHPSSNHMITDMYL